MGWGQILAYMAFCEVSQGAGSDVERGAPGDFGWLTQYYSDTRRNAELANGRLAMMAFVGMVVQDGAVLFCTSMYPKVSERKEHVE